MGLPLALIVLIPLGCGGKSDPSPPPKVAPDATPGPAGPSTEQLWEGPLPPIPTQVSPRYTPLPTLATQRIDRSVAPRRLGELALAASTEIAQIPNVEVRAAQLASLCRSVGPSVEPGVVDQLAQAAFDATGQVPQLLRLQDPFDDLAQCLAHAGAAKRASLLTALFTRAAGSQDLSVFTWPFRSGAAALAQLGPAEAEPLLKLAERLLPQAREPFHQEHLLSGAAAAGVALPPARALALLARAEAGVAGPAFNDARPFFLGELAQCWVWLAQRQPALLDRAVQAILRLGATPFARVESLGQLVALPTFSSSPQARKVLSTLAGELTQGELGKLPATEKAWLLRKLIAQAAQVDQAQEVLRSLVALVEPTQAYRAHVIAVRSLAARQPAEAVRYAEAAIGLLDKLEREPDRNWRQSHLFRALAGVEPQVRQPLLVRLEKRASAFSNQHLTAWTLRKLLELRRERTDTEGLRLQAELMTAVAAIGSDADRLRTLVRIHALGLPTGPAAAETVIARVVPMTGTGVNVTVWWNLIQSVAKQPPEVQKRWLPRLLAILVDLAPTWLPEHLASRTRLVARLAPQVLPLPQAEALILQVWRVIERAPRRSAEVETQHVVNALRAVGVGLASLGSIHLPVLVRRLEDRIPRRRVASEHLMSHVASLGSLLAPADRAGLQKRLETWVGKGTEETRLIRRGAIVAGLVASHGTVDGSAVEDWLAKGPAELSWDPMVQFLIRLPLADLQAKAALLPERRQRVRMYHALIEATIARTTQELDRWRARRDRPRRPAEPRR
jgi:hypothetical protein